MSLQIRQFRSENQTGPSAQRQPLYNSSSTALPAPLNHLHDDDSWPVIALVCVVLGLLCVVSYRNRRNPSAVSGHGVR